jgi:hypothetical protein
LTVGFERPQRNFLLDRGDGQSFGDHAVDEQDGAGVSAGLPRPLARKTPTAATEVTDVLITVHFTFTSRKLLCFGVRFAVLMKPLSA